MFQSAALRQALAAVLLSLTCLAAHAQQWWPQFTNDFDWVGQVDPSQWRYDYGNNNGWGNSELEYYTDRTDNLYTEHNTSDADTDGYILVIRTAQDWYNGNQFTSARINSLQSWTYGTIAIKARLPYARGMWPAFWMLPTTWTYGNGQWPDNGEIDILEQVGFDPNNTHTSLHTHNGTPTVTSTYNSSTITSNYHEYRVDWTPDHISGFVDGNQIVTYARNGQDWQGWPFDKPFYLIINSAVGGGWGGQQGVDTGAFPQYLTIDSINVWKMGSLPYPNSATAPAMPGRIEAENFDSGGEGYGYHTTNSSNPGGQYRTDNIGIETNIDGYAGYDVGWVGTDTWLRYTFQVAAEKDYGMTFRVSSPYDGKSFNVIIDDNYVGTVVVPNTGDFQTWTSVQKDNFTHLTAGTHRATLLANWDGQFNLNWLDVFESAATPVRLSAFFME